MSEIHALVCTHESVKRGDHGWRCDACLRGFFPSGETRVEQETCRLRTELHKAANDIMALQMECKELERKNEILRQSLDDATCPLPIQDEV